MANRRRNHAKAFPRRMLEQLLWLRFWPVVVVTCPLLILPGFILVSVSDSYRLLQSAGTPPRSFGEMGRYRLQQVRDTLTTNWHPTENAHVPLIDLSVPERSIDELNSDLPLSGFVEKSATLLTAEGYKKVKIRYRGDNSYHWFYPKRSWRLKSSKSSPLELGRKLALVNPKDGQFIVQYVDYLIADRFDLMTSPVTMAAVKVNGKYQGLYSMIAPIDESLIRDLQFMPGYTYMGDPSARFGVSNRFCEDPYIWTIESTYNAPSPWTKPPLVQLIEQVNAGTYWQQSFRLFDEAYMARFCAFVSLIGTNHYDPYHNLCVFLDPLAGNFRMVEWDSIGLTFDRAKADRFDVDIATNRIFEELLRHPEFNYQKNQYLYDQINNAAFVEHVMARIDAANERYRDYVKHDKLDRHGWNFRAPGTFDESITELKAFLRNRIELLNERLGRAEVKYAFEDGRLSLTADGYSPSHQVRIRFNKPLPASCKIFRVMPDGSRQPVAFTRSADDTIELPGTLYPGRMYSRDLKAFVFRLLPAKLGYRYQLEGAGSVDIVHIAAQNRVTKQTSQVTRTDQWSVPSCDSIHPWVIPLSPAIESKTLQGQVELTEDWVIPAHHHVTVEPGTRIRLAPGVSILSYGKLTFRGTASQPIHVERLDPDQPWGMVGINGPASSGSRFSHVRFVGGSAENIHNAHYSGMVSIYNASDVLINFCHFERNLIGDDTLRAAKSGVDVEDCTFLHAYGDAIDFDYSHGIIQRNVFTDTGNDAIDLMTSRPILRDNRIVRAGDKGISIGEKSQPIIFNIDIKHANIGIETKDGSEPIIVNCRLERCNIGINGYAKNWRYNDGGHGVVYNTVLLHCGKSLELDANSDLQLFNCAVITTEVSPTIPVDAALIDCHVGTGDASIAANQLIYDVLGLPPTDQVGLYATDEAIRPRRAILEHRFREDLTTNIHGWQASQFGIARKTERVLRVRSKGGSPMTLSTQFDQALTGNSVFMIEARTQEPAEVEIRFTGKTKEFKETVKLLPQFTRPMVRVPPMTVQEIKLAMPGKPAVEIRRIDWLDLSRSPSPEGSKN